MQKSNTFVENFIIIGTRYKKLELGSDLLRGNKKNLSKILANLALVSQIGLTIVIMIVGSIFVGKFLDNLLNTKVLFLVIFTVLAVMSSFYYILKIGLKGVNSNRKGR